MHTSRRNFIRAGAVTLPGMLLLDGCKSSNSLPPPPAPALLITALDVAEVAVSAALPFVGTLDPAWGTYLKAIASVCSNAVSVLDNASLTQAQQYGQIAIAIAQVVAPALPGGGGHRGSRNRRSAGHYRNCWNPEGVGIPQGEYYAERWRQREAEDLSVPGEGAWLGQGQDSRHRGARGADEWPLSANMAGGVDCRAELSLASF